MRRPPPVPDNLAGRSFTLQQQRDAGMPADRPWRQDLRVASRGVRFPWGEAQSLRHTCSLLTGLAPGLVWCLVTAALLWRCPLPLELQNELRIHLANTAGVTRPVRKGVAGHKLMLSGPDVVKLDGVPLTTPARTWLDLAAILAVEDLAVAAATSSAASPEALVPKRQRSAAPSSGAPARV